MKHQLFAVLDKIIPDNGTLTQEEKSSLAVDSQTYKNIQAEFQAIELEVWLPSGVDWIDDWRLATGRLTNCNSLH